MRRTAAFAIAAAATLTASVACADDDAEELDVEFLEYLGSWEAGDDEWVIAERWREDDDGRVDGRRNPTAPEDRDE